MTTFQVPTLAQMTSEGKAPEVLFWVGCAGSFDDRAKKITKAMAKILHHSGVSFAVLGTEEGCTGDPAKRAGNEFLFQMQAMMNIQVLNGYEVKHIVTTCPHCFNTLKNEYPELGGEYKVEHHSQFLNGLLKEGRLKVEGGQFRGKKITFTILVTWSCKRRIRSSARAVRKARRGTQRDAPLQAKRPVLWCGVHRCLRKRKKVMQRSTTFAR